MRVEGITDTGKEEVVYNLTVNNDHTYFVGGDEWGFSIWAHNAYMPKADQSRAQDGNHFVRRASEIADTFLTSDVKFRSTVAYSESTTQLDHALIYVYISPGAVEPSGRDEILRQLKGVFTTATISVQLGGFGHAERRLFDNHRNQIRAIGLSNPQGPCRGVNGCWPHFQSNNWENVWYPPVPPV